MRFLSLALSLALALPLAGASTAQQSGAVIRIIVPVPPGGTTDLAARAIATPLADILGQPVIVENRAGAGQMIGTGFVAHAAPNGLTLLLGSLGPIAISPAMEKSAQYDPIKDFAAVSLTNRLPFVLISSPTLEAKTVPELIALAKASPRKISYASAGFGSVGHLTAALFGQSTGTEFLHVPYNGAAPSLTALLSGDVKLSFTSPSPQLFSMIADGRLRMLGVTTDKPSSLVPGATPIADAVPGFNVDSWFGIMAPAKTPEATINRLNAAINKVLAMPQVIDLNKNVGLETAGSTPAEFQKLIESEVKRWGDVIRTAKLEKGQ
jgi:tripartite-type tricarboxylate transporter receptor subunit TctC